MTTRRRYRAFVSSTFVDLQEHRRYVIDQLRDLGLDVDPMENFPAGSDEPKTFSTERIEGCDICVLLVARRRGHIPTGETKSITQLEYEYAKNHGVDILGFLLSDDALWKTEWDERERDPALVEWRSELKERYVVKEFDHRPDSVKIAPAVAQWIRDRAPRASAEMQPTVRPLDAPIQTFLESVVARLEELQTQFAHDPQRNVLDFYIPSRGSTEPPPKDADKNAVAEPLRDLLLPSIERRMPSFVLADFGMGKTWFLEHLRYEFAKRALENGEQERIVVPVSLSLRGASHKPSFEDLRKQAWIAAFGEGLVASDQPALVDAFEKGLFVFLFDALDEMVLSERERNRVVRDLGELAARTHRSSVVVTCRRSFFADASEERSLGGLGFDVFYLWPWVREDIVAYLEKVHEGGVLGAEPEVVLQKIEETYDLRDISSRAMLSAMLADQWDTLVHGGPIDLPTLYETHVEKALYAWNAPKNWQLSKHDMQRCMEEIAMAMFRLGSLTISPRELDEWFSKEFSDLRVERFSELADYFIRDVKTNSLLLREGDSYAFCHASVWEFLVARRLVEALERGEEAAFNVRDRAANYDSVMQNFLIPMLARDGKLGLMTSMLEVQR
jgi:hypothetical protein